MFGIGLNAHAPTGAMQKNKKKKSYKLACLCGQSKKYHSDGAQDVRIPHNTEDTSKEAGALTIDVPMVDSRHCSSDCPKISRTELPRRDVLQLE